MMILTLLFFSCFLLFISFGSYVLNLNRNSQVNRSFFVLCLSLGVWSSGSAFMNCTDQINIAFFWMLVSTLGWCLFPSCLMNSVLHIINLPLRTTYRLLLYLSGLIFFFYYASLPLNNLKETPYGWIYQYPLPGEIIFTAYDLSCLLIVLYLLFKWRHKARYLREKRQARIIFSTTLIAILSGSVADLFLPLYSSDFVPTGVMFCTIAFCGMGYSIIKYKMLKVTLETEAQYILKTMTDPVLYFDNDFIIKEVNPAMLNVTGYALNELAGESVGLLFHADFSGNLNVQIDKASEITIYTREGSPIPCQFSGTAVEDGLGEPLGTVCIFHDVSEKKKMINELEQMVDNRTSELVQSNEKLKKEIKEKQKIQDRIHFLAYHDSLTELPNRLQFHERLTEEIRRKESVGEELAVVYLDLDNFKLVNDSLGHHRGDELLNKAAIRLNGIIEIRNMAARMGGDEFCVLLTDVKDRNKFEAIIHKILDAFQRPFLFDGHEYYISASLGVSFYPADGKDPDTLVRNADLTMYEAKAAGRNTFMYCSAEIKRCFREKAELRNSLYKALDRDEIMVYYQPQVNLNDNSIVGFEALMRWRRDGKDISPSLFIPIAEETGLITELGKWLIMQVCRQIRTWQDSNFNKPKVSINLSENQLKQPGFIDFVTTALHDQGLDHSVLEFEITERVVFKGNEHIVTVLDQLKLLGFVISIDDFGVDYSSFLNVKKLPVDKIKIDMQFIQGVKSNRKDKAIVEAIINLSHNLGLCAVAEGIENRDHLDFLIEKDCDEGQGYLFYKPMPSDQIEGILKDQKSAVS